METKILALKLFLDELGIDSKIETLDDRKRVQKAVYLGQIAGVDMGYRFGWYIRGPYSSGLTNDYYSLANLINTGTLDVEKKQLKPSVRASLASVRNDLTPPPSVGLSQEDWLELLASLHYLRKVSGFDAEKAKSEIKKQKPHLQAYIEQAEEVFKNNPSLGLTECP